MGRGLTGQGVRDVRSAYQKLCFTIAALVVLQAGFIAWGFFGANDWITNEGGVVNKEYFESQGEGEMNFVAEWGFALHMFFVGTLLIPLVTIITLIVSFFSKVPGAPRWAGALFVLVALQMLVLPMLSHEVNPIFGALHGINAMVLLGTAVMAGRRAGLHQPAGHTETGAPVPA